MIQLALKVRRVSISHVPVIYFDVARTYHNVHGFSKSPTALAKARRIDSVTSLSSSPDAAIGTGLQNIILKPFWYTECWLFGLVISYFTG